MVYPHRIDFHKTQDTDRSRVPPNCRFELDDFEEPWSYSHPFDYIHGRELEGAIRDHDRLFQQAYENLKPGGWFEMASFAVDCRSDDGTHKNATCLQDCVTHLRESARRFGKNIASVPTWKERIEAAGFVNVRQDVFKVCRFDHGEILRMPTVRIVTAEPLAQGSQVERIGEIPPAQHDGSYATILLRAFHACTWMEESGNRSFVGRYPSRIARLVASYLHGCIHDLRPEACMTFDINMKFVNRTNLVTILHSAIWT